MLKLEDVKKEYRGHRGITQVNITIEPGHLYLFVGENGSGKSTTIKLISRVIFKHPSNGKIINDFKRIIYLPDKRSYPKLLTVETYLNYYLGSNKFYPEYLKRYSLPNQTIGSLSKGMIQKLGILQAILSTGDLYLLDEPTDGLDTSSIQLFKEDLKKMISEKKTIIISTHNRLIYRDLSPITYTFKEGICHEKKRTK